jgi:hypothetical protein
LRRAAAKAVAWRLLDMTMSAYLRMQSGSWKLALMMMLGSY